MEAAKYCVFAAILIALVFCDLETLILPDEFTLGGLATPRLRAVHARARHNFPLDRQLVFALLPGPRIGMCWARRCSARSYPPTASGVEWGWLFEKLRHKEGLGFGDVKMLAMVGAFLGIRGALLTIVLGSIAGSVVGLVFIKATGKDSASYPLPFDPSPVQRRLWPLWKGRA